MAIWPLVNGEKSEQEIALVYRIMYLHCPQCVLNL